MLLLTLLSLNHAALPSSAPRVLVTGATGHLGSLLYHQLKNDSRIAEVRACIRNVTKAREMLGCVKCDASEGIYVGDVTVPESLHDAVRGVDSLAIATAAGAEAPEKLMEAIEFHGVENQVQALATQNSNTTSLQVVLCSSMGTTYHYPPKVIGGKTLFWKLNAEAYLLSSGIGSMIVKPCGLKDTPAGLDALAAVHDDKFPIGSFQVSRGDVAAIMREGIVERISGLRFGVCDTLLARKGTDIAKLIQSARWPWDADGIRD